MIYFKVFFPYHFHNTAVQITFAEGGHLPDEKPQWCSMRPKKKKKPNKLRGP
jgi:hypothetical protein